MKKVNKKLSLNKNVVTHLNDVIGGNLPTGAVCGATIGVSVGKNTCLNTCAYTCDDFTCVTCWSNAQCTLIATC